MIDWEEGLYVGARSIYKSVSKKIFKDKLEESRVSLISLINSLHIFSRLICPNNFRIFETGEPYLLKENKICLPASISVFGKSNLNTRAYYFKTALSAWGSRFFKAPFDIAIDEKTIFIFLKHHPEFREWWREFQIHFEDHNSKPNSRVPDIFYGRLVCAPIESVEEFSHNNEDIIDSNGNSRKEEVQGKSKLDVERLEEKKDLKSEAPFHSFEKVETLDDYEGVDRMAENESDLKDKEEALDELNLRHVIRTKEKATSLYSAEISLNGASLNISSGKEGGTPYPEWHFKKSRYLKNWCFVKEKALLLTDEGRQWSRDCQRNYGKLVEHSRRRLAAMQSNTLRKKSQPDGEEFDLEALVDAQIEILRGNSPDEKLYEDRKRSPLNAHIHFLIDTSYSTEAYYQGDLIIDQLKMAAYVLGSSISDFVDVFQISAFSSDTRKNCNFIPIKGAEEPFQNCLEKLGSLEPFGYTRIGPALRHAASGLTHSPCQHKAIILLSDGKPNDYDTYEGTYGIKDIRKAISEAEKEAVSTFAIAYDEKSAQYLPQMFRRGMYGRVKSSNSLIQTASQIAFKIKYGN